MMAFRSRLQQPADRGHTANMRHCTNAGPAAQTVAQHYNNIDSVSHVCWSGLGRLHFVSRANYIASAF